MPVFLTNETSRDTSVSSLVYVILTYGFQIINITYDDNEPHP